MSIDLEAKSLWKPEPWVAPKFKGQEEEGKPAEVAKRSCVSQETRENGISRRRNWSSLSNAAEKSKKIDGEFDKNGFTRVGSTKS